MISKELEKRLESEKGHKGIFDIIAYGSSMKGKLSPNDLDILVIFVSGSLRERLEEVQRIKESIKSLASLKIDIKQILLEELFFPAFMARAGILVEGYSIFRHGLFAETLGFKPYALFYYTLKGLSHSQKVVFNYTIAGRNTDGLIKSMGGERIASGALKIPMAHSLEFEAFLKKSHVNYTKKNILEEA